MVTLEELASVGGRTVATGAERFEHVVVDSRRAHPGDLFVALRGERTDGHRFVADAFSHGAAGALVREMPPSVLGGRTVVQVTDPARALWTLADRRRCRTALRMVGVTGSAGKTTTKEFTADLLATRYRTFRTQGNLNSEIGLPMSLLELTGREEAGVAELGMRGPGEIRMLADLARPQIGIITNIGLSHIGRLGSQDAIAKAKAELFEALPSEGVAILPGDEAYLSFLMSWAQCETWTVGTGADDTVRAENVRRTGDGGTRLDLVHGKDREAVYLPLSGAHFVTNALLAAAAALALDVPLKAVAEAMGTFRAQPGRARVLRTPRLTVVDDAYNASPASLKAALDVLTSTGARRHGAIVGEMRELGSRSRQYHRTSGEAVGAAGLDWLVLIGESDAEALAEGARLAGMDGSRIRVCSEVPTDPTWLDEWVEEGDAVLVKGAHALGLEQVVAQLVGEESMEPSRAAVGDHEDEGHVEGIGTA